jgi:hypothetical protein
MLTWEPYIPRCTRVRVVAISCCDEYEFCSEGGQYLIRRLTGDGHEETARGRHAHTRDVWTRLASNHRHRGREP